MDIEEISATDIRKNVADVLNKVLYQGRHITITWHGRANVVLVPAEWHKKALEALADNEANNPSPHH